MRFKRPKLIHYLFIPLMACSFDTSKSSFDYIQRFRSNYIDERPIQIYLPPSYGLKEKSYPVLYMHDGQMLFDSTTTWNGQEWGVDETMDRLIKEKAIPEAIVVAIWNGNQFRHAEYFPQKPFESLDSTVQDSLYNLKYNTTSPLFADKVKSDNYLKFLTEELKPYIDSTYRTLSSVENTFIAGSSMGGLISMYAICEYPGVFGGAACLSTHWPGTFSVENNPIPDAFLNYLENSLPDPSTHKLYFDYGTETLDALYEPFQLQTDSLMKKGGYSTTNFLSMKFEGDPHTENAWKNRLYIPLTFLLANNEP